MNPDHLTTLVSTRVLKYLSLQFSLLSNEIFIVFQLLHSLFFPASRYILVIARPLHIGFRLSYQPSG